MGKNGLLVAVDGTATGTLAVVDGAATGMVAVDGAATRTLAVDDAATGTVSPFIAFADFRFNSRFPCKVWQQSIARSNL